MSSLVVAAVALFNSEGKLLIGYRPDKKAWCFPAGKMDPRDKGLPFVTAIRELYEEAGMSPSLLTYLGAVRVSPENEGDVDLYCFEAIADGEPTGENDPDGEFTKFAWVDVAEGYPHDKYPIYPSVNGLLGLLGLSDPVGEPIEGSKRSGPEPIKKRERPLRKNDIFAHYENWVYGRGKREALPRMEGDLREKMLADLRARTKTRQGRNGYEYLLHRGMHEDEHENFRAKGLLSWTADPDVARGHAYDANGGERFFERGGEELPIASTWVPESMIHGMPNAVGAGVGNKWGRNGNGLDEAEVIVNHDYQLRKDEKDVQQQQPQPQPQYTPPKPEELELLNEPVHNPIFEKNVEQKAQIVERSGPYLPIDLHVKLAWNGPSKRVRDAAHAHATPEVLNKLLGHAMSSQYASVGMIHQILDNPKFPVDAMKKLFDADYPADSYTLDKARDHIFDRPELPKDIVLHAVDQGTIPHSPYATYGHVWRHIEKYPEAIEKVLTSRRDGHRLAAVKELWQQMTPDQRNRAAQDSDMAVKEAALKTGLQNKTWSPEQRLAIVSGQSGSNAFASGNAHLFSADELFHGVLHHPDPYYAGALLREAGYSDRLLREAGYSDRFQSLTPEQINAIWTKRPEPEVRNLLLKLVTDPQQIEGLMQSIGPNPSIDIARSVVSNQHAPVSVLQSLLQSQHLVNDKSYEAERVRKEVALHPNTTPEMLTQMINGSDENLRENAIQNPNMPAEIVQRFADEPGSTMLHHYARKQMAKINPDYGFDEHVKLSFDTGKLRKIRDHVRAIEEASKTGLPPPGTKIKIHQDKLNGLVDQNNPFSEVEVVSHDMVNGGTIVRRQNGSTTKLRAGDVPIHPPVKGVHKNDFKHLGVDLTPFTKPGSAFVDPDKIQAAIDAAPRIRYNVSHTTWDDAQRHNDQHSKVFQLSLSNDHINKLKAAGVYDTFQKMHETATMSSHPVHKEHGLGWVRYTQAGDVIGKKKECESCGGSGQSDPYDIECSYCDGSGKESSECSECEGSGKQSIECDQCNGVGEADDKQCDQCDGSGKSEGDCGYCNGSGEVEHDCSYCSGTGQEEVPSDTCASCGGDGKVEMRAVPKEKGKDTFFVDEVQSDFGQQFGSHLLANTRDEFARRGRNQGLRGKALVEYVNEQMVQANADVARDFPQDKVNKVNEILWGDRHSSEVLAEGFLQHLRDKGHVGSEIRWHSIDSKAPISLGDPSRKKWIIPTQWVDPATGKRIDPVDTEGNPLPVPPEQIADWKAKGYQQVTNQRIDIDDELRAIERPSLEQVASWKAKGARAVPDIPGHFLFSYDKLPRKILGLEDSTYGEAEGENGFSAYHGNDDNDGNGWKHLRGARVYRDKLRRRENPLLLTSVLKKAR